MLSHPFQMLRPSCQSKLHLRALCGVQVFAVRRRLAADHCIGFATMQLDNLESGRPVYRWLPLQNQAGDSEDTSEQDTSDEEAVAQGPRLHVKLCLSQESDLRQTASRVLEVSLDSISIAIIEAKELKLQRELAHIRVDTIEVCHGRVASRDCDYQVTLH